MSFPDFVRLLYMSLIRNRATLPRWIKLILPAAIGVAALFSLLAALFGGSAGYILGVLAVYFGGLLVYFVGFAIGYWLFNLRSEDTPTDATDM